MLAQRRRPADGEPQVFGGCRQSLVRDHQALVQSGDGKQNRGARIGDRAEQAGWGEMGKQMQTGACDERRMEPAQAVLVEERQGVHENVVVGPAPRGHRSPDRSQQVAVREWYTLRAPGGTGGESKDRNRARLHAVHDDVGFMGEQLRHGGHQNQAVPPRNLSQGARNVAPRHGEPGAGCADQLIELGGGVRRVGEHGHAACPQRSQVARRPVQ